MKTLRTFDELHPYLLNTAKLRTLELDDLITLAENYDYYIKPSKHDDFMEEISSSTISAVLYGNSKDAESILAKKTVEIIIKHFDREFYNESIKRINKVEKESEKTNALLALCTLNSRKLAVLISYIITCRRQKYLFIKSCDVQDFMQELNEIGRRINPKFDWNNEPLNTLCFADCCELISVINKYVTRDYLLLSKLIRNCLGNNPISVSNFLEREEI